MKRQIDVKLSKQNALLTTLNATNKTIEEQSEQRHKKLQEIDHLQDNKCPYCKQQFEESKGKVQEC